MICENTIIGGYSSPYYEEKDISLVPIGGVYSLEGKNFEEIKNINFDRWRKRFIKNMNNVNIKNNIGKMNKNLENKNYFWYYV